MENSNKQECVVCNCSLSSELTIEEQALANELVKEAKLKAEQERAESAEQAWKNVRTSLSDTRTALQ